MLLIIAQEVVKTGAAGTLDWLQTVTQLGSFGLIVIMAIAAGRFTWWLVRVGVPQTANFIHQDREALIKAFKEDEEENRKTFKEEVEKVRVQANSRIEKTIEAFKEETKQMSERSDHRALKNFEVLDGFRKAIEEHTKAIWENNRIHKQNGK